MELINTTEAAEILGVNVRYIRAEIARGKIQATRVGLQYVISRPELERYRAAKEQRRLAREATA